VRVALNGAELGLRRARPDDLQALLALEHELYGEMSYPFFVFRQMLEIHGNNFHVVATDTEEIVAYALAAAAYEPLTAWLLSIGVRSGWRSQGIGRWIAERTLAVLQAGGVKRVLLSVEPDNDIARSLYESLSFNELDLAANYFGPDEDRLIMEAVF